MLIAPDPRPGLTQPHTNWGAQKLIKEKVPTHTPVWYQTISIQVICFQKDRPINRDKVLQTKQAELHRYRCNVADVRGLKCQTPARSIPPYPPTPYPLTLLWSRPKLMQPNLPATPSNQTAPPWTPDETGENDSSKCGDEESRAQRRPLHAIWPFPIVRGEIPPQRGVPHPR